MLNIVPTLVKIFLFDFLLMRSTSVPLCAQIVHLFQSRLKGPPPYPLSDIVTTVLKSISLYHFRSRSRNTLKSLILTVKPTLIYFRHLFVLNLFVQGPTVLKIFLLTTSVHITLMTLKWPVFTYSLINFTLWWTTSTNFHRVPHN